MNLRDWVRGYPKPSKFGAKASLKKDIAVFLHRYIPDLSFMYGWGAVGVYLKTAESLIC